MLSLELFALFLLFTCYTSALYFHIGETEKKCFIEDIPDETMVVGEVVRRVFRKQLAGGIRHHYHSGGGHLNTIILAVDRRSRISTSFFY